jgi:energy-coupling factor transport system permease protein
MADREMSERATRYHGPARTLHPGAWWLWALALAIVASHTTNPLLLGLIIGVAALVVAARREDAPWARAFRMYLFLGATIVAIRVGFRILFGGEFGSNVLFALPEIALPEWAAGIRIGGEVTAESILAAFVDGLRLATIVICFGAANCLANPGRLLRLAPNALYEAGAAITVAMSLAPQLAESLIRVGRARRVRGSAAGGRRSIVGVLLPVLQDALDRALSLAASMDARGYGRSGAEPAARRRMTAALLVVGLLGVAIGLYGVLDGTAPIPLALPIMAGGVVLLVGGMVAAGRRVSRTRYRPEPWKLHEWLVAGTGAVAVASVMLGAALDPPSLQMNLAPIAWPDLALLPTLGVLVAATPAWIVPPPMSRSAPQPSTGAVSTPEAPSGARP